MGRTRGSRAAVAVAIGRALVAAVVVLAAAGEPRAQSAADAEVRLDVKRPDPKDPKAKGQAPWIEATVSGGPSAPLEKLALVDRSAKPPVQVPASAQRSFAQGPETLALALVVLGWEPWIGNHTYRTSKDPGWSPGVLVPLKAALDKADLKSAAPKGSTGAVITYGNTAALRVPMGPIDKLRGDALGAQKDYAGTTGTALVKGLELGLAELAKAKAPVKAMIVLTDGSDTDNAKAKQAIQTLKRQAQGAGVAIYAIVYKAMDSQPDNHMPKLAGHVATITTSDGIGPALQSVVAKLTNRQYVTFAGAPKGKAGLAWDGKVHELALVIDGQALDAQSVTLPTWAPPAGR